MDKQRRGHREEAGLHGAGNYRREGPCDERKGCERLRKRGHHTSRQTDKVIEGREFGFLSKGNDSQSFF